MEEVTVYEVVGTYQLIPGVPIPAPPNWFATNLNPSISYVAVPYPGAAYPMGVSVGRGVNTLIGLISSAPGRFVLIGTSQGAMVTSYVYDELRSGRLRERRQDLVGAITLGNPMREAGHTFPGCQDPGGHGINSIRLTNTEQLWWDFANPHDPATTVSDDITGRWMTTLFDWFNQDYHGDLRMLTGLLFSPASRAAVVNAVTTIIGGVYVNGYHDYGSTTPLAYSGDTRTSYEIGRDYINGLV